MDYNCTVIKLNVSISFNSFVEMYFMALSPLGEFVNVGFFSERKKYFKCVNYFTAFKFQPNVKEYL